MQPAPFAQPAPQAAGTLAARGARRLGRLKGAMAGGGAGVLALVMGERLCQGLAVQPHGSRLRVVRFAEVEVNAPPLRVRPRIQALLARLDAMEVPIRNVVIVSPEVRGMQLDLPLPPQATGKAKGRRGSRKGPDKRAMARLLLQAARMELAQGLDISPDTHLISMLPLVQSQDLFAFEDDDGHTSVPAMAFAITRKHYAAMADILGEFKKRLLGVLPPECFAFATGETVVQLPCGNGQDQPGDESCAAEDTLCLLYSNGHELQGARVSDQGVERFALETMRPGEPLDHVVPRLMQQLAEPQEYPSALLGGVIRDDEKTLDITHNMLPEHGADWGLDRLALYGAPGELEVIESPGPLSPRFMQAAGAAVVALAGKDGADLMLLNTHVSLVNRLRASASFVPAAIVVAALLAMGGLQLHVRMKNALYTHQMNSLKEQKKELEDDAKKEQGLQAKQTNLKRSVAEKEALKKMLTGQIALRTLRLAQLLQGLIKDTPGEIMLTRFEQLSDNVYNVEGVGTSSAVISQYLLQLRNTPIVGETRLVKTSPAKAQESKGKPGEAGASLLEFSIRISLGEVQ